MPKCNRKLQNWGSYCNKIRTFANSQLNKIRNSSLLSSDHFNRTMT